MKLGSKLVVSLVATVVVTMTIHGYLSVRQDQENIEREIRVGMRGFTRAIHASLKNLYVDLQDLRTTREFVDTVGPRGNIHGLVVYGADGERVAVSASLRYGTDFPEMDPTPILALDPRPVFQSGEGIDGYIRRPGVLIYYRVEPIFDSRARLAGAFVFARHGSRLFTSIDERRDRIIKTTSTLVGLLALLILMIVHRSISRPINELIERIREIGKGQWEQRIEVSGRDEVSFLAQEFNLMCTRLQESHARLIEEQQQTLRLEKDLRHSERLASVGQLAAGLAHEIGTPLNIIGGRAEYLLRRPRSPEELDENLQIIRSQIDRIARIVRQLLEFSRRREPTLRTVEIASLLTNVENLLEHKIKEKNIRVDFAVPGFLPKIQADPDLLQQVFVNLYLNSLQALQGGGIIKIIAEVTRDGVPIAGEATQQVWLKISFEDNGAGIPPEHLSHVFDPFFTTKDVGEGTGLGLAVSYGIIKEHGGEIQVESRPGEYTRFVISLPIRPVPSSQEISQDSHEP